MDRFRRTDPDAPRLAAAVLWDEVGPAYTMETFIRGAAAVLDHIELDAIEQPRPRPTCSQVEEKVACWPSPLDTMCGSIAALIVAEGWATEDPEPEMADGYPERGPGFVLGYYEGWADSKAGRQYGEGQHGQRSGLVDAEEPIVMVSEDPEPEVDPAHVEALTRLLMDAALATFGHQAAAAWLLASGRVQVTPQ